MSAPHDASQTDEKNPAFDADTDLDDGLDLDDEERAMMAAFAPAVSLSSVSADFKSGFVALVGRPNAGKSTLLNACMGEHVAITSPVAQTTRKRLRAVINQPGAQIVLVDTPGLHKPQDALGRELNKSALGELSDVDVVAMLVDATKPIGTGDAWVAKQVDQARAARILVITKADLAKPEQVEAQLQAAQKLATFDDQLVVSAKEGYNVQAFLDKVVSFLPYGPEWFPPDMPVDATDEELVAEFIREKVLLNCRDEVPHAVGVLTEDIAWKNQHQASIVATIFVERESQKGILVGKGGSMIRRIGTQARLDIERLLDAKVYLDLHVKVKSQWRKDTTQIRRFGYSAEE